MNKIQKIYNELHKAYGPQGWWPIISDKTLFCEYHTGAPRNDSERFEIAIGCILAQNTQWHPNVVRAIQQLKLGRPFTKKELEEVKKAEIIHAKYLKTKGKITRDATLTQNTSWPSVEKALINLKKLNSINPKKLLSFNEEKLKDAIKPAGYFNQKAKKLKIFSEFYISLNGKTPSREELLKVWGIGPETADSMLLYAYNVPTFVVDAYTKRIFSRLGFVKKEEEYGLVKLFFEKNMKKDFKIYQEVHALIVEHAKRFCKNTPECNSCVIRCDCEQQMNKGV